MIIKKIIGKILHLIHQTYYRSKLEKFGRKSNIQKPLRIYGKHISIGESTIIHKHSWIETNPLTGEEKAIIKIGNNCAIGHYNEIYATKAIIMEDSVLTADRVYISDNLHGYSDPFVAIIDQPIKQISTVRIGEGSWLGVGVAVIGANIGKHCVIGANAVVTKDIPDYSVAVGVPAKVIKRYNFETSRWERTNSKGEFLNE